MEGLVDIDQGEYYVVVLSHREIEVDGVVSPSTIEFTINHEWGQEQEQQQLQRKAAAAMNYEYIKKEEFVHDGYKSYATVSNLVAPLRLVIDPDTRDWIVTEIMKKTYEILLTSMGDYESNKMWLIHVEICKEGCDEC